MKSSAASASWAASTAASSPGAGGRSRRSATPRWYGADAAPCARRGPGLWQPGAVRRRIRSASALAVLAAVVLAGCGASAVVR